jgi:hypothetical protein
MGRVIREVILIKFHLINMNSEDGFLLEKVIKPLIRNLKEWQRSL